MKTKWQEHARMREAVVDKVPWRKWGPYLSERQWGTVREDYSDAGDAWNYFTHEQSRSRAYRWGEDGIAGFSDDGMRLCFALALWNERDPILKERLFGLTNGEGNHGEDVKEYYFYIDSTPTHSYMKMLYKYPQGAFPYQDLVETNRGRSRSEQEYELIDTGIFNEDRYFDVFVEYAKASSPEDILIRISAINRGPEPARLHILPHLWFRNTWWRESQLPQPSLVQESARGPQVIVAKHKDLGERYLYCPGAKELLFTDNETNVEKVFGMPNPAPFVKDGINNCIVLGQERAVNPDHIGTKAAAHYDFTFKPGERKVVQLRLTDRELASGEAFARSFETVFADRQREADEFYNAIIPRSASAEVRKVIRQGFSGLLWGKQVYLYEVNKWLSERNQNATRNNQWFHMVTQDIISMPDKWEYPWFASWDLAFHTMPLALVDPDFSVQQLDLMLRDRYLHPNGQIPAYEWNFSDVNPPVHAWATLFVYRIVRDLLGDQATQLLRGAFNKLILNFTWWVNRKDRDGRNVFEGGFLGLDNIGVFDRSAPLPTGGYLEQADGTAWMALYAQNLLDMAIELAMKDPIYENLAVKFYEHFIWIASAMGSIGQHDSMWDEEDGFYYDVLRLPDGSAQRLKVRSMVGLLPLCAVTVYPFEAVQRMPEFASRVKWFNEHRPDLLANINPPGRQGVNGRYMLALLNDQRIRRVLARLLDPAEFLSDYGIRSLSRVHLDDPYIFRVKDQEYRVGYLPAESDTGMFGGNSNWRGPIWVPTNALIIRALIQMYAYYGNDFIVECPTGSGNWMNLFEVARELTNRLGRIFFRNKDGKRPVYGGAKKFQEDSSWSDYLLFYEYFHGDNGAGLGASHQTGWSAVVSGLLYIFEAVKPEELLEHGFKFLTEILSKIPGREEVFETAAARKTRPKERKSAPRKAPRRQPTFASTHSKPRSRRLHEEE